MNTQQLDMHRPATRHRRLTRTDLERTGLTHEQIDRLEVLAESIPWIEFVESAEEWHQLLFLKWRYETGRLES